jgi:hypothetical protein
LFVALRVRLRTERFTDQFTGRASFRHSTKLPPAGGPPTNPLQSERMSLIMSANPTQSAIALAFKVLSARLSEESIRQLVRQIEHDALSHSTYLREADFRTIHPRDLEFLFGAYDERFFGGLCRRTLEGRRLSFRLSPRMTRAGGRTTCFRSPAGEVSYEISIAIGMLFDGFGEADRRVSVCGLECASRLEALQRIFEHEMVHLGEILCWGKSDCAARQFQDIAGRFFLHRAHTHDLITRRERAAVSGIRVGSRVTFLFEGQRLTGRVNRITKRASVLVADAEGMRYSDGFRYRKYYVPIAELRAVG